MSYNDALIERYNKTVDDEYQQVLLHQASTISFNALMWLNFISAAMMMWIFPSKDIENITVVMMVLPVASVLIGQLWLRKRIPIPRGMSISRGEIVGLVLVILVWGAGTAFAQSTELSEKLGTVAGMLVGALCGGVITALLVKVLIPRVRQRDQKRLDAELDDE